MTELKNIFDKKMGTDLEMIRMKKVEKKTYDSINFVSRTSKNNGVSAIVKKKDGIKPSPPHTLSIAMGGSVLSTFYQDEPFYSGRDLYCLIPKIELTKKEMLFYATYIESYKEKYNYGRQANRTFMDLLVPEKHEIPSWVYEIEIPDYSDVVEPKEDKIIKLSSSDKWKEFLFPEIFEMTRGRGGKATDAKNNPGNNFYIGASAEDNGITQYTSLNTTEKGNAITVANNGSVGASFYQKNDFLASSDVTVITLKNKELNPFIALFLATLIKQIGESFDYGRKWGITRMKESKISLPVDSNGKPDWQLMEDYIKSLPYSKYL